MITRRSKYKQKDLSSEIPATFIERSWHRPMGWFFTIGVGVFVPLVPLHPFQYFLGLLGLWSVMRKKQLTWDVNQRQWLYRSRNFWFWREKRYPMSANDIVDLTWERRAAHPDSFGGDRYGFNLSFIPKAPDFTKKKALFDRLTLKRFASHEEFSVVARYTKQVLKTYDKAGMNVNFEYDFGRLNTQKCDEIRQNLGIKCLHKPELDSDIYLQL
ncbi:hypothetical protein AAFX19_13855 [Vibrio harveyi]